MTERGWVPSTSFERVAEDLAHRIRNREFPVDTALPSETALAEAYSVSRSTVRRALDELEVGDSLVTRHGSRWLVQTEPRVQDLTQLRSFGTWALATKQEPRGITIETRQGRATATEAVQLGVRRQTPVLRIVRVQSLQQEPVMVKRTTYPEWLIPIISALPPATRSIMEALERQHGITLAYGEQRISAMSATAKDARLLGIRRGSPVLRMLRAARDGVGRAFEFSDDRYRPDQVTFAFSNSASGPSTAGGGGT